MRAARYRAGHALRLAALAMLALLIFLFAVLLMTGRMDDFSTSVRAGLDQRLAQSGFVVEAIDLVGATHVTTQDIVEVLEIDVEQGIVSIDPVDARVRIENLSWVESATVRRLWPNRIGVILTERVPYAVWQHNGYDRVIDRSGAEILSADPVEYAHLPDVVGKGANTTVLDILPFLQARPEVAARVVEAIRVGERRWTLRLESGAEVLLPADNPAEAIATLADLHADRGILDLDAQAFDMRPEDGIVIRAWPDRAAEARSRGA